MGIRCHFTPQYLAIMTAPLSRESVRSMYALLSAQPATYFDPWIPIPMVTIRGEPLISAYNVVMSTTTSRVPPSGRVHPITTGTRPFFAELRGGHFVPHGYTMQYITATKIMAPVYGDLTGVLLQSTLITRETQSHVLYGIMNTGAAVVCNTVWGLNICHAVLDPTDLQSYQSATIHHSETLPMACRGVAPLSLDWLQCMPPAKKRHVVRRKDHALVHARHGATHAVATETEGTKFNVWPNVGQGTTTTTIPGVSRPATLVDTMGHVNEFFLEYRADRPDAAAPRVSAREPARRRTQCRSQGRPYIRPARPFGV
jgi:hypothetical protein